MNKGFLYAVTTVFLLVSVVLLVENFSLRQSNERVRLFSLLLGNRITYTWEDVDEDIQDITQVDIVKFEDNVTFYDDLPSEGIEEFLGHYGAFVETYYETPDLMIRFQSPTGEEINLADIEAEIRINPMGITYSYPDYGKNRLFIKSSEENFSSIDYIYVYIELKNTYFRCDIYAGEDDSDRCNTWNPDNRVPSCDGVDYCVRVDLTFKDAAGLVYTFPDHYFDVEGTKKSVNNLNVGNVTASYGITTQFGPLNNEMVMNIDLHNVKVKTQITLDLNTTEFYVEYLSKLMVNSSSFDMYKLDWI